MYHGVRDSFLSGWLDGQSGASNLAEPSLIGYTAGGGGAVSNGGGDSYLVLWDVLQGLDTYLFCMVDPNQNIVS